MEVKNENKSINDKPITEDKKPKIKVEKAERNKCRICSGPERCNQQIQPEIFVECSNCCRKGMFKLNFFSKIHV